MGINETFFSLDFIYPRDSLNNYFLMNTNASFNPVHVARIGDFIKTFIMWIVYDICVTGIAQMLGVSRMVALLIFLGLLLAISAVGYLMKKRMARRADDY